MIGSVVQRPIFLRAFFSVLLVGGSILFAVILAEGVLRLAPGLLPVELRQIIRADPRNYGVAHP